MHTRAMVLIASVLAAVVWIGLLSMLLPVCVDTESSACTAGDLLLDRSAERFYPVTIQNVMWIVFFVAAGELLIRNLAGGSEEDQLQLRLLPEDGETILRREDVGPFYSRVRQSDPDGRYWLQRLLTVAMLQFQSSGSIDQVNAVFNSSMELYLHETELRYNVLRYLVWLIPTLGFIGTVMGIAGALSVAGQSFADGTTVDGPRMMRSLTSELGVAFYTTLLALLQSAGLMFALHMVQGREEGALNRAGEYCLKNLVNRLYARPR